jgi:hypothetical protein
MAKSRDEFDIAVEKLKSANTEEDITKEITFIIKGFNISLYKDILLSNPYYRDILIDVKEDVIFDLEKLKEVVIDEISSIEDIIKKEDSKKIRDLMNDCLSLLYEIDRKISDIKSLL